MPPKAVVYHVCGQHLSGQALVGYEIGPDAIIMLSPRLILRGGAVTQFTRPQPPAPVLNLLGKASGLAISGTSSAGNPRLLLNGGPHIVGKESGMVPTTPSDIILYPTVEEDFILLPTTERSWVLTPTTERDM